MCDWRTGLSADPGEARQNVGLNDGDVDRLEIQKVVNILYGPFSGHRNDPQPVSVVQDTSEITGDSKPGAVDVTGEHAHRSNRRSRGRLWARRGDRGAS